jgi:hypothetical protein
MKDYKSVGGGREVISPNVLERLTYSDELRALLADHLQSLGPQWYKHVQAFLKPASIARILYYADLYKKIVDIPGVICEFGVQWGATLSTLINCRSIYEPYNASRRIYGFDTFLGLKGADPNRDRRNCVDGDYSVSLDYDLILEQILSLIEGDAPQSSIRKFALVKGDVQETLLPWMKLHQGAPIAMAIFDMDIYKPTAFVLKNIKPRLVRGSLLIFDQFNSEDFPGESVAVLEEIGFCAHSLKRLHYQQYGAYLTWEP